MAPISKLLRHIILASSLCLMATGCSSRSQAIDRMVEELNSAQFRAAEARTGLFTDSQAEIEGDTLAITFFCRPHISLAGITGDQLPQLRLSAVEEFKANLANKQLKKGIEAVHDHNMGLKLIWKDTNGHEVKLPLSPAGILQ